MSNNQTREWLHSKEQDFYLATTHKKQLKVLEELRSYEMTEFDKLADELEVDLLCEICDGEGTIITDNYDTRSGAHIQVELNCECQK